MSHVPSCKDTDGFRKYMHKTEIHFIATLKQYPDIATNGQVCFYRCLFQMSFLTLSSHGGQHGCHGIIEGHYKAA